MEQQNNNILSQLLEELKKGEINAVTAIKRAIYNGDIKQIVDYVYKKDNYLITYAHPKDSKNFIENYKKIDILNLKIFPKIKKVINNDDGSLFIISKINSKTPTNTKIYWNEDYKNIPKKHLENAYQDLKTLTNAGFKDSSLFQYDDCWQLTDNNEIIIPVLYNIEKCINIEKDNILSKYYKILFK